MTEFRNRLIERIIAQINNNFEVNQDPWFISSRFNIRKRKLPNNLKDRILLPKIEKYYTSKYTVANILERIMSMSDELTHYEILYDLLENIDSKDTLLEITTYKILGGQHVRLPIENEHYYTWHRNVESCMINNNSRSIVNFNEWKLNLYDLSAIGYKTKIHYTQMGIVTTFGVEQYSYPNEGISIKDNDVVLDCGGCWGDTALYFCSKANNVQVYSFEFIPSNIALFNENQALNENCNITLVPHPVWKDSLSRFYVIDRGPASSIATNPSSENDIPVSSLSIDDLVKEKGINQVDFIKMDIEGAEPYALEGAKNTLTRFKPNLAIAIYHCPEDFSRIASSLKDLNLGYKFYLGHFTPHGAETILFAKAV